MKPRLAKDAAKSLDAISLVSADLFLVIALAPRAFIAASLALRIMKRFSHLRCAEPRSLSLRALRSGFPVFRLVSALG
jgi:hypothetical protein